MQVFLMYHSHVQYKAAQVFKTICTLILIFLISNR